jgi:hypothetical protein
MRRRHLHGDGECRSTCVSVPASTAAACRSRVVWARFPRRISKSTWVYKGVTGSGNVADVGNPATGGRAQPVRESRPSTTASGVCCSARIRRPAAGALRPASLEPGFLDWQADPRRAGTSTSRSRPKRSTSSTVSSSAIDAQPHESADFRRHRLASRQLAPDQLGIRVEF